MDLSKIKDIGLKNYILNIAKLDGETKNAEINKPKEYQQLLLWITLLKLRDNRFCPKEKEDVDIFDILFCLCCENWKLSGFTNCINGFYFYIRYKF